MLANFHARPIPAAPQRIFTARAHSTVYRTPDFPFTTFQPAPKIFLNPTIPTIYPLFHPPKNRPRVPPRLPTRAILNSEKVRSAPLTCLRSFPFHAKGYFSTMNRRERRAAAHNERKLARKAGFPASQPNPEPAPVAPVIPPETPNPTTPISNAQLTANRANAQLSTGPKTEIGRAVSSQNRTAHGLARHNGAFILLSTEDPNGFAAKSLAARRTSTLYRN